MTITALPQFTLAAVAGGTFRADPLVVIDVGATGGFQRHWSFYGDQVRLIGFEPNEKDCEKLNRAAPPNQIYYPVALGARRETRKFYIMSWSEASSFFPGALDLVSRFPDDVNLQVSQETEIATVDLDSFAAQNGLPVVDFMKLDCEGSELDLMLGAPQVLAGCSGIILESTFQSWRVGQPVFNEIDRFMRRNGFYLYDIEPFKHARKALPPLTPDVGGLAQYGQVIWGNFLYFRDAVREIQEGRIAAWKLPRLLKLASLLEVYGLNDCAIELMKFIGTSSDVLDLLMPVTDGKRYTYDEYMGMVRAWHPQHDTVW